MKNLFKFFLILFVFVFFSSCQTVNKKIDESAEIAPSTPYAVTRAAGDMLLKVYHDQIGFPVDFTRAANVYGAGQQLYRIIPRTILACLSEKRLRLDGGGLSERSFIHRFFRV